MINHAKRILLLSSSFVALTMITSQTLLGAEEEKTNDFSSLGGNAQPTSFGNKQPKSTILRISINRNPTNQSTFIPKEASLSDSESFSDHESSSDSEHYFSSNNSKMKHINYSHESLSNSSEENDNNIQLFLEEELFNKKRKFNDISKKDYPSYDEISADYNDDQTDINQNYNNNNTNNNQPFMNVNSGLMFNNNSNANNHFHMGNQGGGFGFNNNNNNNQLFMNMNSRPVFGNNNNNNQLQMGNQGGGFGFNNNNQPFMNMNSGSVFSNNNNKQFQMGNQGSGFGFNNNNNQIFMNMNSGPAIGNNINNQFQMGNQGGGFGFNNNNNDNDRQLAHFFDNDLEDEDSAEVKNPQFVNSPFNMASTMFSPSPIKDKKTLLAEHLEERNKVTKRLKGVVITPQAWTVDFHYTLGHEEFHDMLMLILDEGCMIPFSGVSRASYFKSRSMMNHIKITCSYISRMAGSCSITGDELQILHGSFVNLTSLDLGGGKKNHTCLIQDKDLNIFTNLRNLNLGMYTKLRRAPLFPLISNDGIIPLINLTSLNLGNNKRVTKTGVTALKQLRILDLGSIKRNTITGAEIGLMTNLTSLHRGKNGDRIINYHITNEKLQNHPRLNQLDGIELKKKNG